jgi:nucleotide-binding universal stress UspA family protein
MAKNCPTGTCGITGKGIERILLAVDGSPGSRRAAEKARDMALAFGAEILIVHVFTPTEISFMKGDVPDRTAIEAEVRLAEAVKVVQGAKVMFDTKVAEGNPAEAILDLAENEEVTYDLIVLGAKGSSSVERFFMGSVAQAVVHHSKIPVLVVP